MQTQPRTSLILEISAIDLGFHQTKYTTGRTSSGAGAETTISAASFPSIASSGFAGNLNGARALDGVAIEQDGQKYFVGQSSAKLLNSTGQIRAANENYCRSPEYAALFKGALWHIARHHRVTGSLVIKHLVVGLPMTTVYENTDFLESLCIGVHDLPCINDTAGCLKVEVKKVTVVAQPQGGTVNFVLNSKGRVKVDDQILLIDMGGGTFDWFVSEGNFQPLYELCDAANIGTLNIASHVADLIHRNLKSNQRALEDIDKALRTGAEFIEIGPNSYRVSDYWPDVCRLVMQAMGSLTNTVGNTMHTIKHVVLSGGGAALLQRVLQEKNPELAKLVRVDVDPVYANVRGFHMIAEISAN